MLTHNAYFCTLHNLFIRVAQKTLYLCFFFQAQTATDLIALDRHSLMTPTENIILSTDTHKFEDDNISDLGSEIQVILEHSLDWLKSCQVRGLQIWNIIDSLKKYKIRKFFFCHYDR